MTVAEAARRTDMSESDLRSVNNIPPRMMIKAGSALIVPRSATTRQDVSSPWPTTGRWPGTRDRHAPHLGAGGQRAKPWPHGQALQGQRSERTMPTGTM